MQFLLLFFRLGRVLAECPGAAAAASLRNRSDKTPAEVAEDAGHFELAELFRKTAMLQHDQLQQVRESF